MGAHFVDVVILADGLSLDGLSLGRDAEHIGGDAGDHILPAFPHHGDDIFDILRGDGLAAAGKAQKPVHDLHGGGHPLRLAGNAKLGLPHKDGDPQLLFHNFHIFVEAAEDIHHQLQPVNADDLFQSRYPSFDA